MKKAKDLIFLALAIAAAALLIAFQGDVSPAVIEALRNCAYRIIPNLFAVTVLSNAASKSGVLQYILARSPIDGNILTAFILGNIGGYPVGAGILKGMVEDGRLSAGEASEAMAFCFGCGPAFSAGVLGASVFGDIRLGLGAMLAVTLANSTAFLLYCIKRKRRPAAQAPQIRGFSTQLMVESVSASASAMMNVASMIIFFAAIRSLIERLVPALKEIKLLAPLIEITGIAGLSPRDGINLPTAAALLCFGGVCVLLQIISICGGSFSLKRFFISRPILMLLSAGYGVAVEKILFRLGIVCQAGVRLRLSRSESVIPIICVFAMLFITLSERARGKKALKR